MRFYNRRKKSFRKKTYKKRPYAKKAPLKKYVKRLISRAAETKEVKAEVTTLDMPNFANTASSSNTICLTPLAATLPIAQGTASNQRIGNSISVVSAWIRFRIFPKPYNVTSNSVPIPQVVQVFIYSLKTQDQTLANAQTVAANSILQNNASSAGFQGDLSDWLRDPNNDQIKLYRKFTVKVGAANYESNTGTQANQYSFSNNDFRSCVLRNIPLTKFYPKRIKFNDSTNDSNCRQLYMTVNPMDCDGGAAADTTAAIPLNWEYHYAIKYKDS